MTDAISVATGDAHTLAAVGSGATYAWGSNSYGRLGDGTLVSRSLPVTSAVTNSSCVTASLHHSLALKNDGSVWGWGENIDGQLGTGAPSPALSSVVMTPVRALFPAGTRIIALAASRDDSLALSSTGQVYAWGNFSEPRRDS